MKSGNTLCQSMSEIIRKPKTRARAALLSILILAVTAGGGGTASALVINLTFDTDANFMAAGLSAADIPNMKAACNFAALQFTTNYTDPINVNIMVTAVPGTGTLGMSNTPIFTVADYTTLRNAVAADSKTADDATVLGPGGSLPAADPIGGLATYVVTRSQRKALGLAPDDMTTDGTYTFGGGQLYTYDPANRAVPGRYDFIGTTMHEFSEIMGRIGLMSIPPNTNEYMYFDLFHYTAPGVRGLNNGPGRSFSIDNGTTLLKAFNDGAADPGTDLQDWAAGTNDSFNARSNPGVQDDLTDVDLRVMDVIGYDRGAAPPPPTPTPTPIPTPTPTPTPIPCVPGSGRAVDGIGTIAASGGQASFNFNVEHSRRFPAQIIGFCAFNDPAAGIGFGNRKVTSLRTGGNHAHFTGNVSIGRRMRVFTVDVDDCPDDFSIRIGALYSASGDLTSGDIVLHQ